MTRSLGLSGVTCRSCGPPSGQEERGSISQVHYPGSGTAETPSPLPAKMRSALEGLYATRNAPGPRHHFLVAADPTAELSDDAVALVADVAQCPAPQAMMLPREGWEGQRHNQTAAALLIAWYVALGGSEVVYLDRSETPRMRH